MFMAMKLLCLLTAAADSSPTAVDAAMAIDAATTGGARALGLAGEVGAIAPGMQADLVMLDLRDIAYVPLNSAARQVVFAESGRGVHSVMVGGELVLDAGRITTIDEAALRAEAAALRHRIAAGKALPLAGVPVVVKDSIWVAARRITQGSELFRDFRPTQDALPVERMRRAGAVVIGIGNMPEFGAKEITDNRIYGRTLNPRDLSRTPGGSSGGCAAALAADMAVAALGGDGGGSCRRPPAHVGVSWASSPAPASWPIPGVFRAPCRVSPASAR